MSAWRPAHTLVFQVGPVAPLQEEVDLAVAVRPPITDRLTALAADLGLPLGLHVTVEVGDGAGVTLLSDDDAVAADPLELEEAWRLVAPAEAGAVPFGWDWQRWVATVRTVPDRRQAVGAFLAEVAAGLVLRRPGQLFTLPQAVSYLIRHQVGQDRRLDPKVVRRALAPVIAHGVSVDDGSRVLHHLANGWPPSPRHVERLLDDLRPDHIEVRLAADVAPRIDAALRVGQPRSVHDDQVGRIVNERFAHLTDRLFLELGLRLPDIRLVADDDTEPGRFRVRINSQDGPGHRALPEGTLLVDADPDELSGRFGPARPARNPATHDRCAVVDARHRPALAGDGWRTWTPLDHIVLAVAGETRRRARDLVDVDTVEYDLALLQRRFPTLVAEVLAGSEPADLLPVVRGLLGEGVSVRNLRLVLERVLACDLVFAPAGRIVLDDRLAVDAIGDDPLETAEHRIQFVRMGMKDYLAHRFAARSGAVAALVVGDDVADRLRGAPDGATGTGPGRLSPSELGRLRAAVRSARVADPAPRGPVLLTTADVRSRLASLLVDEFPGVVVLAFEELPVERALMCHGHLSFEGA